MTLLFQIYSSLRIFIDFCIDFIFGLYYNSKRRRIPAAKNKLVLESACSLSSKIRNRLVSAEDVVRAFVERIEEVNDYVNAVVDSRFQEAINEARKIDEDIKNMKFSEEDFIKKPILGVPFTAKESMSSKGLKWSLGLICRKDVIGTVDSKVVELMKNAGAIQIGVTNIPQLNFWMETYNPLYGTTRNPYDTTRNVGGSSGGEGSIISACGSPLGIGSDIGGSIRIPSFRSGIFGHKTSSCLISNRGLSYMTGDERQAMVVAGPMAKYVDDLILMFKVLLDKSVVKLHLDEKVDVRCLNLFYMTSTKCVWSSSMSKEMRAVLMKVVNYFSETMQMKPKEVKFENARYSMNFWAYMLKLQKRDFKSDLTNRQGKTISIFSEVFKYLCGASEYTLYTILNLVNVLTIHSSEDWAREKLQDLKNEVLDMLRDDGVLLFPSEPFPASYHYTSLLQPHNISYYALWNSLDMPVTQVPLGLNAKGLPIGIQVVAAPYQDHLCLAVAKELEKAFGGYVPPFKL